MSTTKQPQTLSDEREERLDRLYGLREQLQTIADDGGPYSKYAEEALRTLREEGYDV